MPTRTFQTGLPVLQQVPTAWGSTTYGNYSGTLESRGLRETQVLGGTLGGGSTNTYSYDDRGQLTLVKSRKISQFAPSYPLLDPRYLFVSLLPAPGSIPNRE